MALIDWDDRFRTGLEITRILASGDASAAALARSRTIDALVLKRSVTTSLFVRDEIKHVYTISGHARFAGNTSGDKNNIGSFQGLFEAIYARFIASNVAFGIDVTNVRGNT